MIDVFTGGIAIPFLGTAFGAACVFFMKRELSRGVQRALTEFAADSSRDAVKPSRGRSARPRDEVKRAPADAGTL